MDAEALAQKVRAGDARAVACAISWVEDGAGALPALSAALYPETGRAYTIGLTGAPGVGKSSLTARVIETARGRDITVAVLAIDPTSPFTGGALLGDRLRMQTHATDPGVFIRSMATRGHLGGLARATGEAAVVLDAAGFDVVIIETVGVGQDEVDIVRTADVSIVTLVPGTGDEVQALKAGIMEIADIFVVNKADREGADRLVASIEAMLGLSECGAGAWRPPVIRTQATSGAGVPELVAAIGAFRAHAAGDRSRRSRARNQFRFRELLASRFLDHVDARVLAPGEVDALLTRMAERTLDPYTAAGEILRRALGAEETA